MKQVIYFVHYSTKPGGIEVLLPVIINELKDKEVKVFVIRPTTDPDLNVYKNLDIEIEYGSASTLLALMKFFRFSLKNHTGIYHLFNTGPFFLFVLRLAGVKKVIYSIHGTLYWRTYIQKGFRKLFWLLGNTGKTIYISNSAYSAKIFKETVLKSVSATKIYNPISLKRFNANDRRPPTNDVIEVIFAGRLTHGKNLFLWIEVAEFLLRNGVKATFSIYGTGELYWDLEQRIKGSVYKENIKLKGYVAAIEEVYKTSDLLLFLSEYESFGNVAVEAILCGVPVLVFNIPSMLEIFCDHPAFLIDKDKNEAEQVLQKVRNINELRSEAEKAAAEFSQRFSTQQHIYQLSMIYGTLK